MCLDHVGQIQSKPWHLEDAELAFHFSLDETWLQATEMVSRSQDLI